MKNKISVIVPIFNTEPYLPRCIDSIINQTYQNLEIILIDDASQDKCDQICKEYMAKDDRVIVIHKKQNGGISRARNSGLDVATGEYITFIDSDDHIDTIMLETMMVYLVENDLKLMEIEHKDDKKNKTFNHEFTIENSVSATKRVIDNTNFAVWRKIFKRSLVKDMR